MGDVLPDDFESHPDAPVIEHGAGPVSWPYAQFTLHRQNGAQSQFIYIVLLADPSLLSI
jgi:hypothetical protein